MIKKIQTTLLMMIIAITFAGCSGPVSNEPVRKSDMAFDTIIMLTIYDENAEELLDKCFEMCRDFENKWSRTIETSEISQINQAGGAAVTVSDETIELLRKGVKYSELSGGVFDITIAPVTELWDFKTKPGTLPDAATIAEAVTHVNYKNIQISGNEVTLTDPHAKIDLGGIAKGYIADQLKAYLKSQNVEHAMINLGGNVLTIGTKPDGSAFQIGIQRPFDETGQAFTSVSVRDESVVSSGSYQRYFELNGKIYHHIIDPKTGYPFDHNLLGVTIISEHSVDGDALSTTCFSLGLDKGMELIRSLDEVEAIFITDDYELHYSNPSEAK